MGIFCQKFNDIVQVLTKAISGSYDAPAYWNNTVYYAGPNDEGKVLQSGQRELGRERQDTQFVSLPRGDPVISSDGTQNGIIWMISSSDQLIAYDVHEFDQLNCGREPPRLLQSSRFRPSRATGMSKSASVICSWDSACSESPPDAIIGSRVGPSLTIGVPRVRRADRRTMVKETRCCRRIRGMGLLSSQAGRQAPYSCRRSRSLCKRPR